MITNIILSLMVVSALVLDLKTNKIPNYITFPGIIMGIILYIITDGFSGLAFGALGAVAGIALLLIPFAIKGIGGGDVKLLGAIGAFKGAQFVFTTFLASAIFGGIIALIVIIWRRKIIEVLKWCFKALYKIFAFIITKGRFKVPLGSFPAKGIKYPYGLAIALGAFLILGLEVAGCLNYF